MLSRSLVVLAAAASGTLAATPQGFEPAAETSLLVTYGPIVAMEGSVLAQAATQIAPSIGTQSQLDGTSFAVLMIDLDIPTANPPETNTLLHWMQTGLTQDTAATTINTTMDAMNAFLFQTSDVAAFAAYIGPAPPARIPLSHRYTQILVDTSAATEDELDVLKTAAANRSGFNALSVLTEAGLADKVLAGNFFNVTNAGPASNSTTNNAGGSGSSSGTGSVSSPTQTAVFPGAAVSQRASELFVGMAMIGAVFLAL
ncbi:Uu.00g091160.m01.CDS01 [Anthostomella pinea]|uniref:Uu.00g091160.m01.CDS01 n=1 Tax=Anthostomella pinea TaxID=933095 RepID=A0AAI8VP79_9PEZI|nr:Uu.00g091160.m01.CDS01 [Anthostomella pinea]